MHRRAEAKSAKRAGISARARPTGPRTCTMVNRRRMNPLCVAAAIVALPFLAGAADKKAAPGPNEPAPSTRTFFIDGVNSDADVQAIIAATSRVASTA